MCFMCDLYGENGEKWFLNRKNFARQMYRRIRPEQILKPGDATRGGAYGGAITVLEKVQELRDNPGALTPEKYDEEVRRDNDDCWQHGIRGQVISLQEAYEVIDRGNPWGSIDCICRRGNHANLECDEKEHSCSGLGVGMLKWERWPERFKGGVGYKGHEEFKQWVADWNKKGYVADLMTFGGPYVGGLCLCDFASCSPIRDRQNLGIMTGQIKGHMLAKVNEERCNLCGICLQRCTFGAMKKDTEARTVWVDWWKCFGCGLCETGCNRNAIELIERKSIPMLKEAW